MIQRFRIVFVAIIVLVLASTAMAQQTGDTIRIPAGTSVFEDSQENGPLSVRSDLQESVERTEGNYLVFERGGHIFYVHKDNVVTQQQQSQQQQPQQNPQTHNQPCGVNPTIVSWPNEWESITGSRWTRPSLQDFPEGIILNADVWYNEPFPYVILDDYNGVDDYTGDWGYILFQDNDGFEVPFFFNNRTEVRQDVSLSGVMDAINHRFGTDELLPISQIGVIPSHKCGDPTVVEPYFYEADGFDTHKGFFYADLVSRSEDAGSAEDRSIIFDANTGSTPTWTK